ncbi:hypothetical protein M501DRAFT_1005599 [Patellaria atrata CBS 101060]|uniref:Uncharacterized protein n=1 Tax=Patellaria atrata CBS 101060 TaxID=1346257 RepID=A0A9P4SJU0_9PEZI|nr:hypothetical protein M501DRAFT_1005599 [Patellaria atrata CBS 101060]
MRLSSKSKLGPLAFLLPILLLSFFVAVAQAQGNRPEQTTTEESAESTTEAATTTAESSTTATTTSTGTRTFDENTSVFHLSNVPTIAGYGIPTMIVPYTANAPYMQKSNLPEGTVFIAVGAILGVLGASVLAWRGAVAWSLHRSVKRAAMAQYYPEGKSMLRGPGNGFYKVGGGSSLSLDHLSTPLPKPKSGVTKSSVAGSSSLFFSPTAGAGLHSSANRSSSFLPAGYYASTNSAPAGGAGMTHIGGGGLLSSLGPQGAGYSRAQSIGHSPPGSPNLPPSRGADSIYGCVPSRGNDSSIWRGSIVGNVGERGALYGSSGPSTSTLNLNTPGTERRAPSAYLEDLFENHGNGPRERF